MDWTWQCLRPPKTNGFEVLHKLREQFTRNIDSLEKDLARKMNRNLAKGHENGDDYRLDGTVARCGQNSWMIEMKPDVDAGFGVDEITRLKIANSEVAMRRERRVRRCPVK